MESIIGEEYNGVRLVRSWVLEKEAGAVHSVTEDASQDRSIVLWLRKGFLPDGYPNSVTPDYLGNNPPV